MSKESLIKYVKETLEENDFTLDIRPSSYIECGGFRIGGYFNEEDKVVAVAKNNVNWERLLAHEFCHFTQWSEQIDLWTSCYDDDGVDYNTHIDNWLEGSEDHSKEEINHFICTIRDMEWDNEKRTDALLCEFGLSKERLTSQAAAYIYFHNVMADTRCWFKNGYAFSEDTKLFNMVEPDLNQDFTSTPDNIADYMRKNCIDF